MGRNNRCAVCCFAVFVVVLGLTALAAFVAALTTGFFVGFGVGFGVGCAHQSRMISVLQLYGVIVKCPDQTNLVRTLESSVPVRAPSSPATSAG